MAIKSVAKLTEEFAFGTKVWNEETESWEYTSQGIHGTSPEGETWSFEVVRDGNNNPIISLQEAQHLEYNQFEVIARVDPEIEDPAP